MKLLGSSLLLSAPLQCLAVHTPVQALEGVPAAITFVRDVMFRVSTSNSCREAQILWTWHPLRTHMCNYKKHYRSNTDRSTVEARIPPSGASTLRRFLRVMACSLIHISLQTEPLKRTHRIQKGGLLFSNYSSQRSTGSLVPVLCWVGDFGSCSPKK